MTGISRDVEGASPIDSSTAGTPPGQPMAAGSNGSAQAEQNAQAGSYIAEVSLKRASVKTEQGEALLAPGMQVTADIKTGRRTVISYLLSPLDILKQNSLRE